MSKKPASYPKMPFVIESMDPLGQGVFKENGNIVFIAKTLPGESGNARIIKAKKSVKFAKCESIENPSAERITPECPHFNECPGCHYLHTSYNHELDYKVKALAHLLQKLPLTDNAIELIPASQRTGYRNRIQLHYREGKIGLIDGLTDTIVEIPECKILRGELTPALTALYNNKSWIREQKKEGHCEIYLKDGQISQQWNKSYSHGGFTQVFDAMNTRLCDEVLGFLDQENPATILDLFAGDGNLTNSYTNDNKKRVMVDATPSDHDDFITLDLFSDDALQKFQSRCKDKSFDTIVIDPPRKGFPDINAWVKQYRPKSMIYVSCNPATLARDLLALKSSFRINKVLLMDLFPGTYHFETVVYMSFKKH